MFLLTRSFACIALVVAALPDGHPPAPNRPGAIADMVPAAVESACRRNPAGCLAALNGLAGAALSAGPDAPTRPTRPRVRAVAAARARSGGVGAGPGVL